MVLSVFVINWISLFKSCVWMRLGRNLHTSNSMLKFIHHSRNISPPTERSVIQTRSRTRAAFKAVQKWFAFLNCDKMSHRIAWILLLKSFQSSIFYYFHYYLVLCIRKTQMWKTKTKQNYRRNKKKHTKPIKNPINIFEFWNNETNWTEKKCKKKTEIQTVFMKYLRGINILY